MESKNVLSGDTKALTIVSSIIMICIGLILFFNPRFIVRLFSAGVLVYGVMLVITYLCTKNSRNGWDIIIGIINILFGAVMLFGSVETRVLGVVTMEMYIGFWTLFTGITHIFGSFALKKAGMKNWTWTLIGGVLLIICSVIFISMPLISSALLVGMAGIYASVSLIVSGFTGMAYALSDSGK